MILLPALVYHITLLDLLRIKLTMAHTARILKEVLYLLVPMD